MNYKRQYDLLIEKAKSRGTVRGYKERHHIIPRCMGGGNGKDNIVELTAREHYVAHRLLWMHYRTRQMACAWHAMARKGANHGNNRALSSRDYERVREALSTALSPETRKKLSDIQKGKKHTAETRKKLSEINKGKVFSTEHRKNMSASQKGKVLDEEHRKRISEAQKYRWARLKSGIDTR